MSLATTDFLHAQWTGDPILWLFLYCTVMYHGLVIWPIEMNVIKICWDLRVAVMTDSLYPLLLHQMLLIFINTECKTVVPRLLCVKLRSEISTITLAKCWLFIRQCHLCYIFFYEIKCNKDFCCVTKPFFLVWTYETAGLDTCFSHLVRFHAKR